MRAPSPRSDAISAITASLAFIAAVSVNSSSTSESGTPCSMKTWRSRAKKSARSSWRGLTLNATRRSKPSRCQLPSVAATSPITQSPISEIRPVLSATGMKLFGMHRPLARMVPAQERLGADELARHEAELRLIGEHELAALHGFGQRLFGIDLALVRSAARSSSNRQCCPPPSALARYMAMSAARISDSMLLP